MEDSGIPLAKLSQEEIRFPITVVEEKEQDQWEEPRDADLFPELEKLKNQTSSTVIIFYSLVERTDKTEKFLDSLRPIFEQEGGHFFPPEFLDVLIEDLNGTFYCNYTTDADKKHTVNEHVSWSCFKIKQVKSTNEYGWIQPAVFVKWNPKNSRQTVFCSRPPEALLEGLLQGLKTNKPSFASREYNPFVWHTLFTQAMIPLYDDAIWSMRHVVRDLEKSRNDNVKEFPKHFPSLNDVGRHLLHSIEILEVAEHTVQSLIEEQTRWRTEQQELVDHNRSAWIQHFQKLVYLAKSLHSLHARARSLNIRLHNEIPLSVALANQSVALATLSDNSVMKSIGLMGAFFLPGTFISGIFGTNFFNINGEHTEVSNNFWLFWVFTIPATLGTFLVIYLFLPIQQKKKQQEIV